MKKRTSLVIIGLSGLWASILVGANNPPGPPSDRAASKPLPPELAESKATEKTIAAHIKSPHTPMVIATPPPSPRTEKKLPAPADGYVWVPGHWRPVVGQWQWTQGEWATPATPVSVWMEPTYDSKTEQWSSGYWQPDRAESYETDTAPKDAPPPPRATPK